jgi:two-component system, NarL family, nitrate/nitrite response regulator NarL
MQKILIVDDHPLYREGMMSALRAQMAGVEVSGAGSAEEGLELLTQDAEIDLVLIDVRLPGMDGFAALSIYGARFPTVPRMLISGSDEPHYLKRAFEAGASGYIPKSMAVSDVIAAIRRVLDGGLSVPEAAPALEHETRDPMARLTLRQLEVLRLLGEGYTNKEIGRALEIAERTAKAHVAAILEALGADNRTQAVIAAQRSGYLSAAASRE